jgi:hypothetical protein
MTRWQQGLLRCTLSAVDAVYGSSNGTVSAMEVGAYRAPTIRRSKSYKQSRQSVSISRSRFFRFTASMRKAMCCSVGSSSAATCRSSKSCRRASWSRALVAIASNSQAISSGGDNNSCAGKFVERRVDSDHNRLVPDQQTPRCLTLPNG